MAHEDNAGHACVKVVTYVHDLVVDLGSRERASETSCSRRAKGASHGTARLRRDTYGKLVSARHTHALYGGSIRIAKEIFPASVLRDLSCGLLYASKCKTAAQRRTKSLGEVRHVIK